MVVAFISQKKQQGFMMLSLMIGLLIMAVLAALAAGKWSSIAYEASAQATGKYMLTVRGAVNNALSRYNEALTLVNISAAPSGTYPVAPAWATFTGDSKILSIKDLKDSNLLAASFPDTPPLGRSIQIKLMRTPGICPGVGCEITAYVYTCWPIAKFRVKGAVDITSCPAEPASAQPDSNLIGKVIEAADGYGGSNSINGATVHGALFNFPAADLGLSAASIGHVAVVASLNSTMFNQFVRQGDSRQVYLGNQLEVAGKIISHTSILADTAYAIGASCDTEGATAQSNRQSLLMCKGGTWFELNNYTVMASRYAANGETIAPSVCPGSHLQPFSVASLQIADTTMTGTDIDVQASLAGTIKGTGSVSSAGSVSVSGTFTGSATSSTASKIRVAQSVEIISNVLKITPASASARALIIQGCRAI
jgi:type II secretory pathway pseudopilin PulG